MADKLTKEEARVQLKIFTMYSERSESDPEAEHEEEDLLYKRFIHGIALGKYELAEAIGIAKILKKISKLSLTRWYA